MPVAAGGWDVTFLDARHGLALGLFGESEFPHARLYHTSDSGARVSPDPNRMIVTGA